MMKIPWQRTRRRLQEIDSAAGQQVQQRALGAGAGGLHGRPPQHLPHYGANTRCDLAIGCLNITPPSQILGGF